MDDQQLHRAHQEALFRLLMEFDRVCKALKIPYMLFAGTMLGAVRHGGFIPWDDDLDIIMFRRDYMRFLAQAPDILEGETFFLQKEFSDHWPMFFSKLRLNGTTCLEKYHPKDLKSHQGIYIDIFPLDDAAGTALGRMWQYICSKVVIAKALDRRGYETDSAAKKLFMVACRLLPGKWFHRWATSGRGDSQGVHSFFAAASGYEKNIYPRAWFVQTVPMKFSQRDFPVPAQYDRLLTKLYGDYNTLPPLEQRAIKRHAILIDPERSYEHYEHYRDNMRFDTYTRSIR